MAACFGCATWSISEPGRMVVAAALHDPLSLLAQRSPGERASGALFQTKPARKRAPTQRRRAGAPRERVLSNVRSRPPAGPAADVPAGTSAFAPEALPPIGDAALPGAQPAAEGPTSFSTPPPAGGFDTSPGPGGGTVTNPIDGTPPDTGATPVPAVPEPATWLMMVVGLGGIGGALRRRRAVTARDPSPSDRL